MRKRTFFLIIISLLSMFTVSFASVSAQSIDVDSMDDAQLLALLQAILQKLEDDETDETPAAEPAETPEAILMEEPAQDPISFEIYENKKLTVEKLPDYMFIRRPTGGDDTEPSMSERERIVWDIVHMMWNSNYLGGIYQSESDLYDDLERSGFVGTESDAKQYHDQIQNEINRH